MDEIFKQYIQTHRSQGADGSPTEHELLVRSEYDKFKSGYKANFDLLTPYLLFANGWKSALDAIAHTSRGEKENL